jgi:2',3'-cyclic-nucleotide 2'-phosphodiesterase (5'-nucleotidase family)
MSTKSIQKKFTILHSNDIHGDFQEEVVKGAPGQMVGGLSRLSGYINKVRREEKNVLYLIAGDMVQGSMIDTEFKGVSTMELMNYLSPDVATIGNHELDYGLYHLLFLEKMANFPIVVYNDAKRELELLTINGQPVQDDKQYSISLLDYYYQNTESTLGIKQEALTALAGAKVVTTAMTDVVEEYLRNHQNLNSQVEGRVVF